MSERRPDPEFAEKAAMWAARVQAGVVRSDEVPVEYARILWTVPPLPKGQGK